MYRLICQKIHARIAALGRDQDGASAIEYAIIAALIAVALITFLEPVRDALGDVFEVIADKLGGAT